MKTSENVNELFKAQVAMQADITNVGKDSKGYGYNYTSLEKLIEHCKPVLAKHGLGIIQIPMSTDDGKVGVTSRLIHSSGQWVEDTMTANLYKIAKMNEYQTAGSIITYFRRYQYSALVGVASDEDINVQGEVQPMDYSKPTASKATDTDKKRLWAEFTGHCQQQEVDPVDFLNWLGVDMDDKNAVHNTVVKWLKSGQQFVDQLYTYKNRE